LYIQSPQRQPLMVVAIPMWQFDKHAYTQVFLRLAVVVAFGALTAACFQPLYGDQKLSGDDSIRDKMSAVEIPEIKAQNGSPDARLAVSVRNALLYDLNGGANPVSPTHRLTITMGSGKSTVIVDVTSGRPETEVENINATLTLTEIATNKVVMTATTFSRASFDIPGSAQRFAAARAARNSEDRAVDLLAHNIRNRLASYFVAGT
jgi:LPS-assembly lipoprotein